MPKEASKCPFCGTNIESGYDVCKSCGAFYNNKMTSIELLLIFIIIPICIGFLTHSFDIACYSIPVTAILTVVAKKTNIINGKWYRRM